MFLTSFDLAEALGVSADELRNGATWHLPGDGGASVIVKISHDDESMLSVSAVESSSGEESTTIAWLAGDPSDDGFNVSGRDMTGESSNSEDPRSAAAAIRRQILTIRESKGGRKVA